MLFPVEWRDVTQAYEGLIEWEKRPRQAFNNDPAFHEYKRAIQETADDFRNALDTSRRLVHLNMTERLDLIKGGATFVEHAEETDKGLYENL